MDRPDVLARFDREVRQHPAPLPGVHYENVDGIVRAVGAENVILYADLVGRDVRAAIEDQRRYFADRGTDFEWKVYAHDQPPDLAARLADAGFQADPEETLLIRDLAESRPESLPAGVEVRPVRTTTDFSTMVEVTVAAFGQDHEARLEQLRPRLGDPTVAFYVAYVDGVPASSGRLELPEGTAFAGIWGGGTVPALRHRGVYRSLVAVRAEAARARGYRYLMVEAAPTSRPILERIGFEPFVTVAGWHPRPSG